MRSSLVDIFFFVFFSQCIDNKMPKKRNNDKFWSKNVICANFRIDSSMHTDNSSCLLRQNLHWYLIFDHGKVVSRFHKVEKDLRRQSGFNPITFTFSENSNYWQESLLEAIRQNIAGHCQQTFCFRKFLRYFLLYPRCTEAAGLKNENSKFDPLFQMNNYYQLKLT